MPQRFKLGRNRPIVRPPTLTLGNYLLRRLPPAPPSADYTAHAKPYLAEVYGNADAGDCTIAAALHIAATILANSHESVSFTGAYALEVYKQLGGWNGIPNDPSDAGLGEDTVLNYWSAHGFEGHYIAGFAQVHPDDIRPAIWLLENVYIASLLPQKWIDDMSTMDNGFVWDVAGPGRQDAGHAYCALGYTPQGLIISTWGLLGTLTWAAVEKYAADCTYTVLSPDILDRASQLSPEGANWTQLVSDLQSLGST